MYPYNEIDPTTNIVARVLHIESKTLGDPKQNYIARYQGHLISDDSAALYDQLSESLRPLNQTPLFRKEGKDHIVYVINSLPRPRPSNPWINLIFFTLTAISVLFTGIFFVANNTPDNNTLLAIIQANLGQALAFTVSILAILLSHEFGHYLTSVYHKTSASLPYFIPFPFSPFGTMGAVIFQKEPHKNKRILLDIGMAGPLAGFIVGLPILILGLYLSKVEALPSSMLQGQALQMEGNSLLYLTAKLAVFGKLLPSPATYGALNPIFYWLRYFFTGQPFPYGGVDVMIHPVAWAGWAGMLVTALNLIPAGQLDGGHIIHSLLGRRASILLPIILIGLALLGLVWTGWWLWALLIFFLGRSYAEPLDQITPLDMKRKVLAAACLVIFILVFTPVPLTMIVGR
jgi:membrane-associated protease RseP (regulator of RpoE activity)